MFTALSVLFHLSVQSITFNPSATVVPVTCGADSWATGTGLVGGLFTGIMDGDCQAIVPAHDAAVSYLGLQNYLVNKLMREGTLHNGPVSTTFNGLPAQRLELTTVERGAGGDTVTIREIVHVATNERDQLVYDARSISVSGTGDGKYVRNLDVHFDVRSLAPIDDQNNQFGFSIRNVTKIEKPWFAPGGVFERKVRDLISREFKASREKLIPEFASQL